MPNKQLERLLFLQGGRCFFCGGALPKVEASVEHLTAKANGGANNDDNCVACCKALNHLLGNLPLKEKLRVVLNQRGQFRCPVGAGSSPAEVAPETPEPGEDRLALVLANLRQRGHAKPRRVKTLTSTIASVFVGKLDPEEIAEIVTRLRETGHVAIADGKVTYSL